MPRKCTVCAHPERERIDRKLASDCEIRKIASLFAVSASALRRHRDNHMLPELRERYRSEGAVDPAHELQHLYARVTRLLDRAEAAGSWPAVRGLAAEARQELELLAKLTGGLDESPRVGVLVASPEWVRVRAAVLRALEEHPQARDAVVRALKELEGGGE